MNRYELLSQIGDGTFGRVMKAKSKESGEVVAIKHIKKKFKTWKACVDLREVQSLRMTGGHPNIVMMKEVIRESDESLYFVFEYLPDGTLYDLMKKCTNTKSLTKTPGSEEKIYLSHERIVSIMKQIFAGLSHMNRAGFFHRDIKPENILVDGDIVKVADFGLAREVRSQPPFTYYVSTRWYRAPEVILHSAYYGPPIDMFACGLLLSELYTLQPLFPGTSEIDQIHKMTALLGPPTEVTWSEGVQLMKKMNIILPQPTYVNDEVDSNFNIDEKIESMIRLSIRGWHFAANLIRLLIQWNPSSRPNADNALRHEYFGSVSPDAVNIHGAIEGSQASQARAGIETRNRDDFREQTMSLKEIGTSSKLPRPTEREPNEFLDYLNAISSSGGDVAHRDESVRGALQSKINMHNGGSSQRTEQCEPSLRAKLSLSTRNRPRPSLSVLATPYKEGINAAATSRSAGRRDRRRSWRKSSNRTRTADKPQWLLSNQNMGKGAIEVRVQVSNTLHTLESGDSAPSSDKRQEDLYGSERVWNPF
ncbi:hypothetical protein HJC23_011919 [Cyclotella cryptica]|uniref:Protein kinase domain-containing protein n=1 Tax=Cyclotella cryptica TaxID=29204 RepID=A0ABD3NSW1_9STRA|eukprot:CCRYP_020463-RA/>CCRYP_020463-RA protein AED:0.02 eAED:0.40 QI:0/0/0/1/1/1/3/0/534